MPARDEEATLAGPTEDHCVIQYPDDVEEQIDPRFHALEKTASKELDESLSGTGEKNEIFYVRLPTSHTFELTAKNMVSLCFRLNSRRGIVETPSTSRAATNG